jgi:hypothetical protein
MKVPEESRPEHVDSDRVDPVLAFQIHDLHQLGSRVGAIKSKAGPDAAWHGI